MLEVAPRIFTIGGTVQAGSGLYLARQADQQLLEYCRAGEFVSILSTRQVGKSSLMIKASESLAQDGVRTAIIDLTQVGTPESQEAWYKSLLYELEERLSLRTNTEAWWEQRGGLSYTERLTRFFREVVLAEISAPMVIFIDEIDYTLKLDFTDDFFAALRFLYNGRAQNPEYRRLSFVLVGVASAADLISDQTRTPFNLSQHLKLTDFSFEEALPLTKGFNLPEEEARQVLNWVLNWTGGHPYLTQCLCQAIVEQGRDHWTKAELNKVATSTFLGEKSEQNYNLQFVRKKLTHPPDHLSASEVLITYRQIWQGKHVADEEQSLVKSYLKLSGVVKRDKTSLVVRNRIYHQVFNRGWIRTHLLNDWAARYRQALVGLAASLAVLVVIVFLAVYAFIQGSIAVDQQNEAIKAQKIAEAEANRANTQSAIVVTEKNRADAQLTVAVAAQKTAEAEKARADELNKVASSRQLAALARSYFADQSDLAFLLSLEAININNTAEAQASLFDHLQSTSQLAIFLGHSKNVRSVAFSLDGQTLVSGSADGTIRLWEVATQKQIGPPLTGHKDYVYSVAFSPDGKTLASGGSDGTVRLWEVATQKQIGLSMRVSSGVLSVAFSPDGKTLASGSNGTVQLWEVTTQKQIDSTFIGHKNYVNSVAFSPDGKTLASGGSDGIICLWKVATESPGCASLTGHIKAVVSVAFSPDGQTLASGGSDGTIRLWDVINQKQLGAPLTGHTNTVFSVDFSPDGRMLVSGSADKSIRLWDVYNQQQLGQPIMGHLNSVLSVAFSPDSKTVVSSSDDGTIRLWNVTSQKSLGVRLSGHNEIVRSVAFSPDGKILASGSNDKTILLWDVVNQKQLGVPLIGTKPITSVAFNPEGKILVSGSSDGFIQLWNVETQKPISDPLMSHSEAVTNVAFSPDGQTLASSGDDGTIRLWDVKSQSMYATLLTYATSAHIAFNPQDGNLVSTGPAGTILFWNVANPKPPDTFRLGNASPTLSIAFSPDGKTLAIGNNDGTIRLWDVQQRRLIVSFPAHTASIHSIAFSPDSKMLASGSRDKTVRLWEVASQQSLGVAMSGHSDAVYSVAFSPDGKLLASASADTTIQLWKVLPGSLPAYACRLIARNFTFSEWQTYLGSDTPYRKTCPDLLPDPNLLQNLFSQARSAFNKPDLPRTETIYKEMVKWASEFNDTTNATTMNNACWAGSIDGFAKIVLPLCERAVELNRNNPNNPGYIDSRGLARALTGDYEGAIKDFQVYKDWAEKQGTSEYKTRAAERQLWIDKMKAGQNVADIFDKTTLNTIRSE